MMAAKTNTSSLYTPYKINKIVNKKIFNLLAAASASVVSRPRKPCKPRKTKANASSEHKNKSECNSESGDNDRKERNGQGNSEESEVVSDDIDGEERNGPENSEESEVSNNDDEGERYIEEGIEIEKEPYYKEPYNEEQYNEELYNEDNNEENRLLYNGNDIEYDLNELNILGPFSTVNRLELDNVLYDVGLKYSYFKFEIVFK